MTTLTHPGGAPLESSPFFKEAVLRAAEDFKEIPDVSLFVMAKNAESCLGRLLGNVRPYIREVVAVLNDCTDGTRALLETWCKENDKKVVIVEVTTATHPDLYILDVPETYEKGRGLIDEVMPGPFTGAPILADWASARNLGWNLCTCRWRLFLDADDVLLDPWAIPGLCEELDRLGIDLACSIYQYQVGPDGRPRGAAYRERLVRNLPHIQWTNPIHEVLTGASFTSHIQGNLIAWDKRDNAGVGIRIPGRNFKILYHQAREADWEVSPRVLANLLAEVRHYLATNLGPGSEGMMEFAQALFRTHETRARWPEERGWTAVMMGEIYERRNEFAEAKRFYQLSLEHHPGAKAAFRLSRALFMMNDWEGCVKMYELGVANMVVHSVLDGGDGYEALGRILAAGASVELDRLEDGLKYAESAMEAFPDAARGGGDNPLPSALQELLMKIQGGLLQMQAEAHAQRTVDGLEAESQQQKAADPPRA